MSEPINPPQTIPSYHLSRLAREARAVLMAHYLLRAAIYVATLIEDCTRYLGNSYAAWLTNCIYGVLPERSSNLTNEL